MKPLKQIRLSDQIARHLCDYIEEQQLRPGDSLPSEVELARQFEVGRPTVREAINALAGNGIVRVSSGKPPVVGAIEATHLSRLIAHGLTTQQISALDTLALRSFIEERSVMLAARHRTPAHLDALHAALDDMRGSVGDLEAFSAADIRFHKTLALASGNPLVALIIDGIADVAMISSISGLRRIRDADEWRETLALHAQIAAAVDAGDAAASGEAMQRHFARATGRLSQGGEE